MKLRRQLVLAVHCPLQQTNLPEDVGCFKLPSRTRWAEPCSTDAIFPARILNPEMADEQLLPPGYRHGIITSISVGLGASIIFFCFVVFEQSSGLLDQLGSRLCCIWRALQPTDEQITVY